MEYILCIDYFKNIENIVIYTKFCNIINEMISGTVVEVVSQVQVRVTTE